MNGGAGNFVRKRAGVGNVLITERHAPSERVEGVDTAFGEVGDGYRERLGL